MSLESVCSLLRRIKCRSDCQQVCRSSWGNMSLPIHYVWWKWMVPCVVILQRRHPHPRMTCISSLCQNIECARAHRVSLCTPCTFEGSLLPKESLTWVGYFTDKDVWFYTWSLSWFKDQIYSYIQDFCRNQSKEGLERQQRIHFYPSIP